MTLSVLTTLATVLLLVILASGFLATAHSIRQPDPERTAYRLIALALFVFDAIALCALTV